jgi:ATP-dependent Clp protease ATP-binding subunit ClpA
VLLGLIKEGSGDAARVLRSFGLDLRACRSEVEKVAQVGSAAAKLGKLPQTSKVQEAIQFAYREGRNLGYSYVDTQHLLLGVLRDRTGVATQVLLNLGLSLDDVRARANAPHASTAIPAFKANYAELGRLPAKTVRKLIVLDKKRARLKGEIDAALAKRDFKKADRLRNRMDQLWADRSRLLQEAPPSSSG